MTGRPTLGSRRRARTRDKTLPAAPALSDGEFRLAVRLYRDLVVSPSVQQRLEDGEEPNEVHEELARRAVNCARTFWAESERQVSAVAHRAPAPDRGRRGPRRD